MLGLFINNARSKGLTRIVSKTWGKNSNYIKAFEFLNFYKLETEYESRDDNDRTIYFDLKL